MIMLTSINWNDKISPKDHLILHAYHAFINQKPQQDLRKNLFDKDITERIFFYQKLIERYNRMLCSYERQIFEGYISTIGDEEVNSFVDNFVQNVWQNEKPVIWSDREKPIYYLEKLTKSHRFEIYLEQLFLGYNFDIGLYYSKDGQYSGESASGIEIKFDEKSLETGNLYIETNESLWSDQNFVNSGIFKDDNTKIIAIGNFKFIFFFRRDFLVELYNEIDQFPELKKRSAIRGTSKGFIMPISFAEKYTLGIEEVINIVSR